MLVTQVEMSQKSMTTTTSFIVSSNESLNKPVSSSSQSTTSSDMMTVNDSIHNNQYFASPANLPNPNDLTLTNQRQQPIMLHANLTQSDHQAYSTSTLQQTIHVQSPATGFPFINNVVGETNNRHSIQSASLYSNGNQLNRQSIHGLYMVNNSNGSSSLESNLSNLRISLPVEKLANEYLENSNHSLVKPFQNHENNNSNHSSPNSRNKQSSFQHKLDQDHNNSPVNRIETNSSNSLMPMNVKGMLLNGVTDSEVMRAWLTSIKCEEYIKNFLGQGYDMNLLSRMTPQDLTAVGCKSPTLRKKLLLEIKKLNLEDDIPGSRPHCVEKWLELLKLSEYQSRLFSEGYDTIDKICELTWEDLEEIGIYKLGHQKRLLLGIERVKKFDQLQEERQCDNSIYDVHPNHRISLSHNTTGRSGVRSGLFQTRSGANLDHRGLPVATVMPALKHVTTSASPIEMSHQVINTNDKMTNQKNNADINSSQAQANINPDQRFSDLSTTLKRNPPPLPPIRTNSLKIVQSTDQMTNEYSIYGNTNGMSTTNGSASYAYPQQGSTSFLRTPKLGTLTATTNKMLTLGGHIQPVNGQNSAIRSMFPVREAPLPPNLGVNGVIPECVDENSSVPLQTFPKNNLINGNSEVIASSIGHQLASADEFPPPPPCP